MNDERHRDRQSDAIANNPLIKALGSLSEELLGIRFIILIPDEGGWREVSPAGGKNLSEYCRLIQSSADGAKHCRMCHVLMSVAMRGENHAEQQCHAGQKVFIATSQSKDSGNLAILSACTYHSPSAVATVRARAKKLGLDVRQLEKAFRSLPRLSPKTRAIATAVLQVVAEGVAEVIRSERNATQSRQIKERSLPSTQIGTEVKARLSDVAMIDHDDKGPVNGAASQPPMLVRILTQLVDERPELPFIEKDIAAAARTTPNYLSALFRQHVGICFSDYVSDKRLALAKDLLRDMTLSISEVSRRVGYDDPGYFTRRFRQATGLSPRIWRHQRLTPRE